MPRIDAASWIAWIAVTVAQVALAVVLVRSGAWRRWFSVLAYVCLEGATNIALMFTAHPKTDFGAACYFWTYWIESAAIGLVQVWIIQSLGLSVAQLHKGLRYLIGRLVPAIAIIYVLGSLLLIGFPDNAAHEIERIVMSTNEAATIAWLATYVTLLFSCQALGLVADRIEQGISVGFGAFLLVNAATGWLLQTGIRADLLNKAAETARIFVYLLWIYVFIRKSPPRGETSIADLRFLLHRMTGIANRILGVQ